MALSQARREQKVMAAIRSYGQRLSQFIRRRVRSDEEAEDILQDVWLQLASVVDLDPIERMSAWLFRVARNRITDRYRKKRALPVSELSLESDDGEPLEEILFIESATAEDEAMRSLFYEALSKALDELPEEQRRVFVQNEIEGRTFQEIADETGENIKTLISRKRYAVAKLRKSLSALRDELSED